MKLYLSVKRRDMANFARHTVPHEVSSVEQFLASRAVANTIDIGQKFGDQFRVMEENPDPAGADTIIKTL